MAEKLSDPVKHFFTINEFRSMADLGHQGYSIKMPEGTHDVLIAPGLKLSQEGLNQVRHHAVLGHGLAVQAIARGKAGTKVGPAEAMLCGVPLIETPERIGHSSGIRSVREGSLCQVASPMCGSQ